MGMVGMKKVMVGFVALGAAALQAYPASATTAEAPPAGSGSPPAVAGPNTHGAGWAPSTGKPSPADVADALGAMTKPAWSAESVAARRALATNPASTSSCSRANGAEACVARRFTTRAPDASPSAAPQAHAAVAAPTNAPLGYQVSTLPVLSRVCNGTGNDNFRVQVVYAHTTASPSPARIAQINTSLGNVDAAFANSAARTGGRRDVRWVTDNGSPGCHIQIRTAQVTTGATDFNALLTDLVNQGAVDATKIENLLIFTEGALTSPQDGTCGVGLNWPDDRPLDLTNASTINRNLYGFPAAVDLRCWDIDGGGSVPAHELMHTLGAVQGSAPHAANSGHCWDEHDLMCYGPNTQVLPECSAFSNEALFDCNNDDYFNTDPLAGQYLCDHWNTADSLYLEGWSSTQPPRAVTGLSASASAGGVSVDFGPTASCYGADSYRVTLSGVGTVDNNNGHVDFATGPGSYTVSVTPYSKAAGAFGTPASVGVTVPVPNQAPYGGIVISATQGHSYGLLAYAFDPESDAPTRVRVNVEGVSGKEYDWNYTWDDMPRYTGLNHHEAFVFLAQLPSGDRNVCFDAQDPQDGSWTNIGCRRVSVK